MVTVIVNLVVRVEKISQNERRKQVLRNIEVTAESISITGKGNFKEIGPKYKGLVISHFNVRFKNKNDKVAYTMRLCNNNSEDVLVQDISIGRVFCVDTEENAMDCGNVIIRKGFYNDNNEVMKNTVLKKNACMNANVDLEYVGENVENELLMNIEQFSFNIKVIDK